MSNIEKIRQEIERMHQEAVLAYHDYPTDWLKSRIATCVDILAFIDSLPKLTCKSCGFYENNCPFIRGKFIPYPNNICKDYTYSVLKDELPRYYGN